jgi:hypothetical protein
MCGAEDTAQEFETSHLEKRKREEPPQTTTEGQRCLEHATLSADFSVFKNKY